MKIFSKAAEFSLYILILVIPFGLGYIWTKPFAINLINVFSIIFIILTLLALVTKQIKRFKLEDYGLKVALIGLVLVIFYSLIFTHPLRNGAGIVISRLFQPILVGWCGFQLLANKKTSIDKIIKLLIISLGTLIIGGFLQHFGLIDYRDTTGRITVLNLYPNSFARYVEVLLILALPYIIKWKINGYWVIWFGGILLLLSTQSYNGTATFILGLLVIIYLIPSINKRRKLILLGLILIITGSVLFLVKGSSKWERSTKDSRVTRLEFWTVAIGTIKDHPLTGIGIKGWETQYPELLKKYGTVPYKSLISPQPHDFLLDSLLKGGIFGLLIVYFLLYPILSGIKMLKKKDRWFAIAMISFGVALFCFGFIDDPLWSDDILPIIMLVLFMASYLKLEGKSAD